MNNPNVFILDSLLEHPDDWIFHKDPTYCFITHKSGLCLKFFRRSETEIYSPDWAKLHQFSEEQELIYKAIKSLQQERHDIAKKKLNNRLAAMFNPQYPARFYIWDLNVISHPVVWGIFLFTIVIIAVMCGQ